MAVNLLHLEVKLKKVLITGSATGLGRVTAEALCNAGYHVLATMRDVSSRNASAAHSLQQVSEAAAGRIEILELDVTSADDIQKLASHVGDLYGLVNNAGLGALGLVESFSIEQARQVFDVNLFGPLMLTKALMPTLAKTDNAVVINISSAGGRLCFPFLGVYNASKYALEGLMESWNIETKALGVDLCLVEPGAYPSDLHDKRLLPKETEVLAKYGPLKDAPAQMVAGMEAAFQNLEEVPSPTEVADAVLALLALNSGDRPVRTVVGEVATQGIRELNAENEKAQKALLAAFGL